MQIKIQNAYYSFRKKFSRQIVLKETQNHLIPYTNRQQQQKKMKQMLILITMFFRFCSANSTNYIANGSFDLPVVPAYKSFIACQATGWTGQYFDLIWDKWVGRGQALDLQRGPGQNGYIEQTVVLPNEGYCNLSFYKQGKSTNYNSFVLAIYWNGQLIATENTNTTFPTFHSMTVCGMQGNNNVRFQEKGDDSDWFGTIIDEISLTCDGATICMNHSVQPQPQLQPQTNSTNSSALISIEKTPLFTVENAQFMASLLFSTPASQIVGLKYIYLFAQDLWLYHYDKVEYQGTMNLVFNATYSIEKVKFNILETKLYWNKYSKQLWISDYRPFTRKKFVQIEETSSVLIKAVFSYFVYIVPLNILICLVLYLFYRAQSKNPISHYFRSFNFVKTTLMQTLIEGNVAYFTYVCFGHLGTSFNFRFWDKASLVFTIVFLWVIFVLSLTQYVLISKFLKKSAGLFLSFVYRCDFGCFYLGIRNLFKNFLRGAIFYFLHEFYEYQLLFLAATEGLVIILGIYLQNKKKIVMSKLVFSFTLLYNLLLLWLNLILYFCYKQNMYEEDNLKRMALEAQSWTVCLLVGKTCMLTITDFLPLKKKKSSKKINQDLPKIKIKDQALIIPKQKCRQKQDKKISIFVQNYIQSPRSMENAKNQITDLEKNYRDKKLTDYQGVILKEHFQQEPLSQ